MKRCTEKQKHMDTYTHKLTQWCTHTQAHTMVHTHTHTHTHIHTHTSSHNDAHTRTSRTNLHIAIHAPKALPAAAAVCCCSTKRCRYRETKASYTLAIAVPAAPPAAVRAAAPNDERRRACPQRYPARLADVRGCAEGKVVCPHDGGRVMQSG